MAISITEVQKIARLARLQLTPMEEQRYAETISAVLDYMKILNEVDTTDVLPTAQVTGLSDIYRSDIAHESAMCQELVNIFPEKEADQLKVMAVFNHDTAE